MGLPSSREATFHRYSQQPSQERGVPAGPAAIMARRDSDVRRTQDSRPKGHQCRTYQQPHARGRGHALLRRSELRGKATVAGFCLQLLIMHHPNWQTVST